MNTRLKGTRFHKKIWLRHTIGVGRGRGPDHNFLYKNFHFDLFHPKAYV